MKYLVNMRSLISFAVGMPLGFIYASELPAQQRITVSYPGIAGYKVAR